MALNVLTILLTVALAWYSLRGVHLNRVGDALSHASAGWIALAFVAFLLSNGARALRWRSLFLPGRRPRIAPVTDAMLIGYLFNNILPARAGEAARVVTLSRRGRVPAAEVVGTALVERVFDVLALLIIFFTAQPWLPRVAWVHAAAVAAAVLAAAVLVAVVVLAAFGERPLEWALRPFERLPFVSRGRLELIATELADGLHGLRHPGVAIEGLVFTVVAWLLAAVSGYLATRAFPLHVGLDAGILVTVAVGLSNILPAAPASIGVFEASALLALHAYGISHTQGLPFALVLHALNFVPFVVAGVLVVQHNARHPPATASPPMTAETVRDSVSPG